MISSVNRVSSMTIFASMFQRMMYDMKAAGYSPTLETFNHALMGLVWPKEFNNGDEAVNLEFSLKLIAEMKQLGIGWLILQIFLFKFTPVQCFVVLYMYQILRMYSHECQTFVVISFSLKNKSNILKSECDLHFYCQTDIYNSHFIEIYSISPPFSPPLPPPKKNGV